MFLLKRLSYLGFRVTDGHAGPGWEVCVGCARASVSVCVCACVRLCLCLCVCV